MRKATSAAGLTATVALIALATPAGAHTVEPGDTLHDITGGDWHHVCVVNVAAGRISSCDLIRPGQELDTEVPAAERALIDRWFASLPAAPQGPETDSGVSDPPAPSASEGHTAPSGGTVTGGGKWANIIACESGGDPRAVNPNGHYGLFQFDLETWQSVGGSGNPIDASVEEQFRRAEILYAQRGFQPWACSP